jgi:hypothetical protein
MIEISGKIPKVPEIYGRGMENREINNRNKIVDEILCLVVLKMTHNCNRRDVAAHRYNFGSAEKSASPFL